MTFDQVDTLFKRQPPPLSDFAADVIRAQLRFGLALGALVTSIAHPPYDQSAFTRWSNQTYRDLGVYHARVTDLINARRRLAESQGIGADPAARKVEQ